MKIYIVRSTSQKLCTPPQTSARLLTPDIIETATTVTNPIVTTIVVIDITEVATRIIEAIATTKEVTDITILTIATTAIAITIATGMDTKKNH